MICDAKYGVIILVLVSPLISRFERENYLKRNTERNSLNLIQVLLSMKVFGPIDIFPQPDVLVIASNIKFPSFCIMNNIHVLVLGCFSEIPALQTR